MKENNTIILIGYSGHAYVIADVLLQQGYKLLGYMENGEKLENPLQLAYLGPEYEEKNQKLLNENSFIVAIGDNTVRRKLVEGLLSKNYKAVSAIHQKACIASNVSMEAMGMVLAGAIVNSFARIGIGVILNTGCIVEHECVIGAYSHIAPGAVLAGKVKVGENTFIGANAVVKQGVTIGSNVIIGAGAVVIRDVPDNTKLVGNPARIVF